MSQNQIFEIYRIVFAVLDVTKMSIIFSIYFFIADMKILICKYSENNKSLLKCVIIVLLRARYLKIL